MKGTIVVLLPYGSKCPDFRNWEMPEGFKEYLDGMINILYLPKGGSIYIGEAGVDVVNNLHKQLHKLIKEE